MANPTVTLSDGSVWERDDLMHHDEPWRRVGSKSRHALPYVHGRYYLLTAADHRAIADVLDPPKLAARGDGDTLMTDTERQSPRLADLNYQAAIDRYNTNVMREADATAIPAPERPTPETAP